MLNVDFGFAPPGGYFELKVERRHTGLRGVREEKEAGPQLRQQARPLHFQNLVLVGQPKGCILE